MSSWTRRCHDRPVTRRTPASRGSRRWWRLVRRGQAADPARPVPRGVTVTRAQVFAAQGKIITDQRLGLVTPAWVVAVAAAGPTRTTGALVLRLVEIETRDEAEILEAHRILAELDATPAETEADLVRAVDDLRLTVHSLLEVLDRPAPWPRSHT